MPISKHYFGPFSIPTLQAINDWAQINLLEPEFGEYGMKISYLLDGSMFAETELTDLTIGNEYTINVYVREVLSNQFKVYINELPNDNLTSVAEIGWGLGLRTVSFTATETTMYLAIGDVVSATSTYSIIDEVSVLGDGTNYITNGTFEDGTTTGWYPQLDGATIEPYLYAQIPVDPEDNIYYEPVSIPAYDPLDPLPDQILITTTNGNETLLNEPGYQHFYVEPGDYVAAGIGLWTLTEDGDANNRRTISLYNPRYGDIHPASMPMNTTELMNVNLAIQASYWTIDRHSALNNSSNTQDGRNIQMKNGATNNIINRAFADNSGQACIVRHLCHNNTIQKCRFQNMRESTILSDAVYISLFEWHAPSSDIYNTKIIGNELVNGNDCIQLVRSQQDYVNPIYQHADYQGTIIDSNIAYADATRQSLLENALDIKAGSDDPLTPVIVTNNIWFGWNEIACDGDGSAVVMHYQPHNVVYENNISFDCNIGLGMGSNGPSSGWGGGPEDSFYRNNLIYQCGDASRGLEATLFGSCVNTKIENNAILNCEQGYMRAGYNDADTTFQLNDIGNGTPNSWDDTGGNNSAFLATLTNNDFDPQTYTESVIINYDIHTATPRQIVLPNASKTEAVNQYLEPVNIPLYTGAADQLIITTAMSIATIEGHMNGGTYQHFYIEAGDYGYTPAEITLDGGSGDGERRTISAYNPLNPTDETHPGLMAENELSQLRLYFNDASYWDVDRLGFVGGVDFATFRYGSSFNTINRMYTDDCSRSIWVRAACHNNTIQNSRFNAMSRAGRISDTVCISLHDWTDINTIMNTKIINNEIRNQNDGIQLVRADQTHINDGQGTIIDSNDIWLDNTIYTDGSGNLDPNGLYTEAEDAIDLKYGSLNASNPVVITNNHMWGFRKTDGTEHLSGSNGNCIGVHYGVGNCVIENNVFFDAPEATTSGDNNIHQYSMYDSSISNNIYYSCGDFGNSWYVTKSIVMADGNNNMVIENNTIVDCREEVMYTTATYNSTFRYNVIINQGLPGYAGTVTGTFVTTPNTEYTTAEALAAGYTGDYVFTMDKFTNSPSEVTIPNVLIP